MSQENVETVRKLMALGEQVRESGLPPPQTDLVAPDAEIDMSRRVFNPEIYRGLEGFNRLNQELREVWTEWRVTPERFIDVGDQVVTIEIINGRGRASGVETGGRYASIWTFQQGRVTRVESGLDPQEALKAVGLTESTVPGENIEIVRRALDAFVKDGVEAMLDYATPDCVFYPDPAWIEEPAYHGRDAFRAFHQTQTDAFGDFTVEVHEIRAVGERVLALTELVGRSTGSGVPVRQRTGHVFSGFRDGMIGEDHSFLSWEEARKAAALSAPR